MTVLEKLKTMAQTANSTQIILNDTILEEVIPLILESIEEQCKELGYSGITYESPESDYPPAIYSLLYDSSIRPVILKYLNEKHPLAWFIPMYYSKAKLDRIFQNLKH